MTSSAIWVLLTGLGIGWLAGLSVSPVASAVLSSLLGLAAGVAVGLQALRKAGAEGDSSTVDPRPVALLTIGIALGSPLGITARTHGWFAGDSQTALAGLALSGTEISQRAAVAALFSSDPTACDEVLSARNESDEVFRRTFRSVFPEGPQLDSIVADAGRLRLLTQVLCSAD